MVDCSMNFLISAHVLFRVVYMVQNGLGCSAPDLQSKGFFSDDYYSLPGPTN